MSTPLSLPNDTASTRNSDLPYAQRRGCTPPPQRCMPSISAQWVSEAREFRAQQRRRSSGGHCPSTGRLWFAQMTDAQDAVVKNEVLHEGDQVRRFFSGTRTTPCVGTPIMPQRKYVPNRGDDLVCRSHGNGLWFAKCDSHEAPDPAPKVDHKVSHDRTSGPLWFAMVPDTPESAKTPKSRKKLVDPSQRLEPSAGRRHFANFEHFNPLTTDTLAGTLSDHFSNHSDVCSTASRSVSSTTPHYERQNARPSSLFVEFNEATREEEATPRQLFTNNDGNVNHNKASPQAVTRSAHNTFIQNTPTRTPRHGTPLRVPPGAHRDLTPTVDKRQSNNDNFNHRNTAAAEEVTWGDLMTTHRDLVGSRILVAPRPPPLGTVSSQPSTPPATSNFEGRRASMTAQHPTQQRSHSASVPSSRRRPPANGILPGGDVSDVSEVLRLNKATHAQLLAQQIQQARQRKTQEIAAERAADRQMVQYHCDEHQRQVMEQKEKKVLMREQLAAYMHRFNEGKPRKTVENRAYRAQQRAMA